MVAVGSGENHIKTNCPRITIASTQGHTGKTVVSLGLCASLKEKGYRVQPFKRGPDYIDPSWLTAASGRNCRNLDPLMMPESEVLNSFITASRNADMAIIEGAMGLFDSLDSEGKGSTAYISRLLNSPVILVVNASRMNRSVAAMINGYLNFEPLTRISGIILNNVAGIRHEQKLRDAVEKYCQVPVIGSLPRDSLLHISERHLGLVPFPEINENSALSYIRQTIEKNLNFELLWKIARQSGEISAPEIPRIEVSPPQAKIGVLRDQVFTFYYPENLEALERAGAELVFIDSIKDKKLPEINALYVGGGFPECFLPQLQANDSLRRDIREAVENNLPVYAECAGLMYLGRSIRWKENEYDMVGALPLSMELCPRPQAHGYAHIEVIRENPLFETGLTFWGHEFHHSRLVKPAEFACAFRVLRGQGIDGKMDCILYKNVAASYVHIHALGVPSWAINFVKLAIKDKFNKKTPLIIEHS